MLFPEASVSADLGSRFVAVTALNVSIVVIASGLAVALGVDARRGRQALRVAGKARTKRAIL
jgi:hypothetical protein